MSYRHYEAVLRRADTSQNTHPMPETEIARYDGRVPAGLQEVWRRHGTALTFGGGRIQLCDPHIMQTVLAPAFEGDPEFDIDTLVPYAFDSLGNILFTDNTLRDLMLRTFDSVFTAFRFHGDETDPDFFLARALEQGSKHLSALDEDDDLHADCVAQCGSLVSGEVYGFVPPLQIGDGTNARFERFAAPERFAYLLNLGLVKYHRVFRNVFEAAEFGGEPFIRYIGGR